MYAFQFCWYNYSSQAVALT
uniref:Uncharacterized protein n=1 Tax=Arundo donax TaxID=35708 RepID=A0A0A9A3U3_ARUDO